MAKVTEVRLTIAALIYAIEIDLKHLINRYITPNHSSIDFIGNEDLISKVSERFLKENSGVEINRNIEEAIEYLDFFDFIGVILRNKTFLPERIYSSIKSKIKVFENIAPIRNRVMHTRPLLSGDFTTIFATCSEFSEDNEFEWTTLSETLARIEDDPSYVLTLSIPSYKIYEHEAYHNLPIPDFDETGFIGRKVDVRDTQKLILGNNRVVSIIGDGGIGKTALALKVAYDILDLRDKNPFDIIIWCSAKTTMLTAQGINEIKTTLTDFGGVIESIEEFVGDEPEKDTMNNILEHLELFNVLLIIDNLETILDERIREFLREASQRCKILITSRIGLGELEFRRNLSGLSEQESIILIRQLANIKQSTVLRRFANPKLVEIAKKLHYNPLALKWFVNSVETGVTPNEVLNNKDDLLNFCLTNVYDKLSDNAILIIRSILASRRNLNDAELVFVSELAPLVLRRSLNELFATTFISRDIEHTHDSQEIQYTIPEFAKEYILKNHPIDNEFIKDVNKRLRNLDASATAITRLSGYNEFGINAITIRNANEKVVARLLNEALRYSKKMMIDKALMKVAEAKSILPNFFEIYRVSAFIKATAKDFLGAEDNYKTGLSIEPDNIRLLYFYSGFLLYHFDDVHKAFDYAKRVFELRPQSEYPTFLLARILSTIGQNEKGIELLNKLISRGNLSKHTQRIANTDLISGYGYWGTQVVQKDGDYPKAIKLYKRGIKIFEKCVMQRNHDARMVKCFCNTLKSFIKYIPRIHNRSNINYINDVIIKYDELISLNNSKVYFESLLLNSYGHRLAQKPELEGVIRHVIRQKNFAYITSKTGEKIFAHINDFQAKSDFSRVKKGTKVLYALGENSKGSCAINIILKR